MYQYTKRGGGFMAKRTFLDFAASDIAAAKFMLQNGFYDHCARLCQQTVEKYVGAGARLRKDDNKYPGFGSMERWCY